MGLFSAAGTGYCFGGGYIVPVTTRYKILRRFLLASSDNPNLYLWYLIYAQVLIKFPLYSL